MTVLCSLPFHLTLQHYEQEYNLGYVPSLSGRLSSSGKDGSKRFGCHHCSNIVKCSRNGTVNDRDSAQSKEM